MEEHNQSEVEGPHHIEKGIWVDLGNKREQDISSEDLESIKEDNDNYWKLKLIKRKLMKFC